MAVGSGRLTGPTGRLSGFLYRSMILYFGKSKHPGAQYAPGPGPGATTGTGTSTKPEHPKPVGGGKLPLDHKLAAWPWRLCLLCL